jgi:polysaccharide export outer membrane protein
LRSLVGGNHLMNRWLQRLVLWLLLGLMAAPALVHAQRLPTDEELEQAEQLNPAQRKALSEYIRKKNASEASDEPLEEPVLVAPLGSELDRKEKADADSDRKSERGGREQKRTKASPRDARRDEKDRKDRNAKKQKKDTKRKKQRKDLDQFGYDLFAGAPTTFAPATDIPIDPDYLIGPGDTVQVQLFGKESDEYVLVVNREGALQFPGIGPIQVAGMTFSAMEELIRTRVKEQTIGNRVSVTMGRLRSMRVFILGDANRPGSYTVSALTTMTNALFVSGGISPIGSLRDIQLKRKGKVIARLDLYDLLLHGDTSGDARLQPGDVIFVPPLGATVAVEGEVRRPAIYEIRKERTVAEALKLAGGLLPTAYPQATQIERIGRDGERALLDLDASSQAGQNTRIREGDLVHVFSVLERMDNVVLLTGHVERPGAYAWREGMRVSDLVTSLDDSLLARPDLDYALIRRELQPDRRLQLLSVRLGEAVQHPAGPEDVKLQPRDELVVFGFDEERAEVIEPMVEELEAAATYQRPVSVVRVGGLIRLSGQYPLEPNMRVSDLIRAGGGLAESAYALGAELTRYRVVDGSYREVGHVDVDLAAILKGDASADLALQPHDTLNIKRLPEWAAVDTVEIRGEVRFPGVYPIARGEQLSNLIDRAGGLTDMAFPQGAFFVREELREREKQRLEELGRQLQVDLGSLALQLAQEDSKQQLSVDVVRGLAEQLRNVEPTGRLVIDLPKLIKDTRGGRRSDFDVTLMDGDKLFIPPITEEVTVTGEVFYPTSHLYKKNLDQEDYVSMSGGTTKKADDKRIYVVRANGSVVTRNASASWFESVDPKQIHPGDTIVVPLDVERIRPLSLWTSVSQIIYQLAIGAASAKAVGVF